MSSGRFHSVGSALVLAVLVALAATPAQAAERSTLLDNLGAKVQIWVAGWLPGIRIDSVGTANPNGGASWGSNAADTRSGGGLRIRHGQFHRGIKPLCDTGGVVDPNGCPRP